jgi:hypothetical protein
VKRWEAWWNHAAIVAVSVSGVTYGIFKYFVPGSDPDSRIGRPLQPALLKAHILVAPLAVFAIGLIFRRHALARIQAGESYGGRTGAVMLWLLLPLAMTGYLIQIFVDTTPVRAAGWSHAALGVCFLLGYAFHPKRRALNDNGADDGNGGSSG